MAGTRSQCLLLGVKRTRLDRQNVSVTEAALGIVFIGRRRIGRFHAAFCTSVASVTDKPHIEHSNVCNGGLEPKFGSARMNRIDVSQ
jgi:hypothetical protein